MKTIKVQKLTQEAFAKYGVFADMIHPQGEKFGEAPVEFFRDMVQLKSFHVNSTSLSVCRVTNRDNVIEVSESHSYCSEGSLPIDGDIIIHVAPAAAGDVPEDKIEAFLVPKGTAVILNPGVWHHAGYPFSCDSVNVLTILPERTYANDCKVVELKEKIQIEK
ncbi:MAG TPA: ureidoglycolate lyase [Ruminiclostridium sp.]|nr:ureidoglycolate lyase [Ruminiclostridium sp.]